jgi:hypothetical protein
MAASRYQPYAQVDAGVRRSSRPAIGGGDVGARGKGALGGFRRLDGGSDRSRQRRWSCNYCFDETDLYVSEAR